MSTGLGTASRVRSVDHIAIAVRDMAPAARLFADLLGATMVFGGDNDITGVRILKLSLAGFCVELMQPLRENSLLAGHLNRRGEGFHHLTFMVDDVSRTVMDLEKAGLAAVGTDISSPLWSETFLSPRDTFGALLQFARADDTFGTSDGRYTLTDVLAGRVVWNDQIACLR